MRQPEKAHYQEKAYWGALRVEGYANQLRELHRLEADDVLEIGRADGFMSTVVSRFTHHRIVSLDVDPGLRPDVAASVLQLPFGSGAFDVAMCCQVLEHIPFDQFANGVRELCRVARRRVIVSVPDVRMYFATRVRLPRVGWKTIAWSPERPTLGPYEYDGEHYWEIGYAGTRYRDVRRALDSVGAPVLRAYRNPDAPYHCFFVIDASAVNAR